MARWLGPCATAVAFVLLADWSWGKWTDAHIDFGNELYVPWQLSEGKALYRDIAQRNGPFSHYLNALWFTAFGVSIRTLVYCNLAILAGICAMTFAVFARTCGRATATAACLVLLAVFAFSQYSGIGNFNYVTPYQHAQTHGLALSIAMILALCRGLGRGGRIACAGAGACLGLVWLTKAELAAPALAAAALGWLLIPPPGRRLPLALAFGAAALLPGLACLAFLRPQMSAELALGGVLGNWGYLGESTLADRFYAAGAGLDDVPGNLARALRAFGGVVAFAATALALDRALPGGRFRGAISGLLALALFAAALALPGRPPWPDLARGLPLVCLVGALGLVRASWNTRADRAALLRTAPLALWCGWALALLGKMVLNTRFGQYGFALAMPATLVLVAGLTALPRRVLAARPGRGALASALGAAAIAAGVVFFLRTSDRLYALRVVPVGSGADRILVDDPRGRVVAQALRSLETRMSPDATLLVLPEGVALNYWLRRRNPIRYDLFLPAEFDAYGGDAAMLREIRAQPPDFVALVHRRSEEFGVGPFGEDPRNGQRLLDWIVDHYHRIERIGAEPFRDQFGIVLLARDGGSSPARPGAR